MDIIKPKQPNGAGWSCTGPARHVMRHSGYTAMGWEYPERGLYAISAVEVATRDRGPEYHLSISKQSRFGPGRCDRNEAKFVLKAFAMTDGEEDNHVPGGVVRNYWLPVAEGEIGRECPCKATEPEISENKGDYVWRGLS